MVSILSSTKTATVKRRTLNYMITKYTIQEYNFVSNLTGLTAYMLRKDNRQGIIKTTKVLTGWSELECRMIADIFKRLLTSISADHTLILIYQSVIKYLWGRLNFNYDTLHRDYKVTMVVI